jgi:hypothetical protein
LEFVQHVVNRMPDEVSAHYRLQIRADCSARLQLWYVCIPADADAEAPAPADAAAEAAAPAPAAEAEVATAEVAPPTAEAAAAADAADAPPAVITTTRRVKMLDWGAST